MRYKDFERIISEERMNRYVVACGGNTRKAMTLIGKKLNPPSGADGNQHSKDRQLLDTYQIFPQGINKI